MAARRGVEYTPEQVFYAAACAFAERSGVEPRYVELFREDVADPEAVDTLADRDPGFPALTPFNERARQVQGILRVEF